MFTYTTGVCIFLDNFLSDLVGALQSFYMTMKVPYDELVQFRIFLAHLGLGPGGLMSPQFVCPVPLGFVTL